MLPKSDLSETSTSAAHRTRVPLFSAFFMIYIFVSGGSFGIEEMVAPRDTRPLLCEWLEGAYRRLAHGDALGPRPGGGYVP